MKQITVKLLRSELLYEIDLTCFLTGELERNDDENDKPFIQDISREDRVNKATFLMNRAWGHIIYALTAFSKEELCCESTQVDNELVVPDSYETKLNVTDDFKADLIPVVKNTMHAYIVNYVCYEWFKIYKKDECEAYRFAYEEDLAKLKGYMNKRYQRVRRTLRPF